MELNIEQGLVYVEDFRVTISELEKVGRIEFNFGKNKLPLVYINDGDYFFMYSDSDTYNEILKSIAPGSAEVTKELSKYQNDYGIEHELWKQMLRASIRKFDINQYTYSGKINIPCTSDYFSNIYDAVTVVKVENLDDAYTLFESVLPKNYEKTKKKYQEEEIKSNFASIISICGKSFEKSELYIVKLKNDNGESLEKWVASVDWINSLKEKLASCVQNGILNDSTFSENAGRFLEECLLVSGERVNEINSNLLLRQYGPIVELKRNLRDTINRLDFDGLLELFKEYKNTERVLESKARISGGGIINSVYKKYIDIYRLGSVLLSDKMNQKNRNKAKNKYIPQELLDEAMVFYYDTDSVDDAYSVQSNEKYQQDKESGNVGEHKVEYALKWLDSAFTILDKKSKDKVGNPCIYLSNPSFVDEKQEYDHIIVSNNGIFNIETKNYVGKLIIDQYGNWIRKKNDNEEGVKNPLQQIRQHEKVLASFLPKDCKIISIICIANDKAIIEGAENCPIAIVKSDMLVEYIENYHGEHHITDIQKEQIIQEIYNHMV